MTALNSEGLEKAWRFDIQHGPDGEANYAWVYNGKDLVATMRTYHADSIVEAMNRRALPPVDGLEVAALDLAKRIEREFYHDQVGGAVQTRAKVQVIIAEALSQASSVIAGLKAANEALMRERTSLIETKREQIERLTKERYEAVDNGHDWFNVSQDRMERISSLEEENKRLKAVVSASAAALSNGAFISTEASIEFMELLPVEIGTFCDRLEGDKAQLQRTLDLFEATVSFTRRWAIEKDGNGTSAEERLSAIANHPGVKGFQTEDHNG